MTRHVPVAVFGLLGLCVAGSDCLAQSLRRPPVFLREDWKLADGLPNINTPQEPEHAVVPGDVANPSLDVRLSATRPD